MFGGRSLFCEVYSDENLTEAWRKVSRSTSLPGVDRVTVQQFAARLFINMKTLQEDLRYGYYYPDPVRRVYARKSDGELRPLGILTVRDRIVQRALLQVLKPVFDARFEECSYAFRNGRSVDDAIAYVTRLVNLGYSWILEIDIASFFENIDTDILYRLIKKLIRDRDVRSLLKAYLTVETVSVQKEGLLKRVVSRGVLQGGILSPLFANIYLDPFDKKMLRRGLKMARYCDDIVVLCRTRGEAEQAAITAQKALKRVGLSVNPRKTHIVHAEKGFRYLGDDLFLKRVGDRQKLVARSTGRSSGVVKPKEIPVEARPFEEVDGNDLRQTAGRCHR